MRKILVILCVAWLMAAALYSFDRTKPAIAKEKYRIAWSHYVGWEPWEYGRYAGILKKWGDKYGADIELVLVPDYVASIEQYTVGQYIGVTITNMDALIMPAAAGMDTSIIIIGDFSKGNDGVVLKNGRSVRDLEGRKVKIVANSVSHYLLSRALEKNGMAERDVVLVNTSDSDIASAFINDRDPKAAVVTWNPMLMEVRDTPGATMVFDSSQIPGEIIDTLAVRSDAPEHLKKALAGAWYEIMSVMSSRSAKANEAVAYMAKFAGTTVGQFKAQLKTTEMFYKAEEAVAFTKSSELKRTMEYVRTFCFDHGLFGQASRSKDDVGILFPDGTVMGDRNNVKLRFDAKYMELAAKGKL